MTQPLRPLHRHSFADFLDLEAASTVRHEYLDGEIYAMAGGTPEHAALAVSVIRALSAQIDGEKRHVFTSDLRVRVKATGLATYPDVTVICGPTERDPESPTHVTNPTIVVEITSDGTEDYDRGEKLEHYKKLDSLRACVIVSHRRARIDVFTRAQAGTWDLRSAGPNEAVDLPLGFRLVVADVYGNILDGV